MWKMENSPPIRKQPPSIVWICEIGRNSSLNFGEDLFFFFFFWRSPDFGQKKPLNFGFRPKNHSKFFFFYLEITQLWAEKTYEFPSFPRHFASSFGQTVWNWFKINENSSQARLHTSHSFKIAPPFSKSWLRACYRIIEKSTYEMEVQIREKKTYNEIKRIKGKLLNQFKNAPSSIRLKSFF